MTGHDRPEAPAIRVHGSATAQDIAAVIAVLAAAGAAGGAGAVGGDADPDGPGAESTWASHRSLLRGRHDPGPAAWRTTYRG